MLRTVWVGILAFLADRLSKQAVMSSMKLDESKVIWQGILNFTYTQNTGMAFNILHDRAWLLITLSIVALVLMIVALKSALRDTPLQNALLWLLLAGGLGNLIDRLITLGADRGGYVVDFIHIQVFRFPIFNVADLCLTVSAVLLIIALLRSPKETAHEQKAV